MMRCPVQLWAEQAPDALALIFGERSWSYRALEREVTSWVSKLSALGVGAGDRVALLSGNRPEGVFLIFAVRRLGATLALLNARLTKTELAPQHAWLGPKSTIAEEALADRLSGALVLESLAEPAAREAQSRSAVHVDSRSPAPSTSAFRGAAPGERRAPWALLFTSGTTGRSKAVALTEENLLASARGSGENLGAGPDQRWLGNLPLFHVGGLAMVVRTALYGATLDLHPRFDLDAVARSIAEGATHISLVPTTLERLLEGHPEPFPKTLRALLIGGAASGPLLLGRARERGLPVLQTYGLTEACSQVTTERMGEADGATSGPPLPGVTVRISDAAGGWAKPGEVGEIRVFGATVMAGYFRDPEASARALEGGGLRTGDLGVLDERGRLRVLSRRTDLIVSGGENIYPAELEAVLKEHPAVADLAVIGVADARWGQVPVGTWVARGTPVSSEAIEAWARERLAGFKVPKRWVEVSTLPRNASGKVDRVALSEIVGQRG